MTSDQQSKTRFDLFDRALGALDGLPDTVHAGPSTHRETTPLLGCAVTYIVQTVRRRAVSASRWRAIVAMTRGGSTILVAPSAVTTSTKHVSPTSACRSRSAKAVAKARKDRGEIPAFLRSRKPKAKR